MKDLTTRTVLKPTCYCRFATLSYKYDRLKHRRIYRSNIDNCVIYTAGYKKQQR